MRSLFLPIILLALVPLHFSQTADELHVSLLSAVGERRYADALGELAVLEQKHPEVFKLRDYDYLSARTHQRSGNPAAAAGLYLAVANRNSILKPYALFHLSAIARASGHLALERTYLDEIDALFPGSLFADAARNRRARSWLESGNYALAARAFETLLNFAGTSAGKGDDAISRQNRLYLANANLLSGDTSAARSQFSALIESVANPAQPDDFALAAAAGLDKIDRVPGAEGRSVPKLDDAEHLRRAFVYQFNRDFADARLHYTAVINGHPASASVPDAIFQIGRGYVQEGNFAEAVKSFERLKEQFPDHALGPDALLQAASAYSRVGKIPESVKRYQDFISKYPGDARLDRAYLNIIDAMRDSGEETEALKWAAKTQEAFRGKLPEALALFSEVRINLARSDWDAALAGLDKLLVIPDLGGAAVPGGTSRPEAAFLRGYALEQKRRFPEAIKAYLSIPDGRAEYYGWRATERLQVLQADPEAQAAVAAELSELLHLPFESSNDDAGRRRLQAALRLEADPDARGRLLEMLRQIYSRLPAYRNVPSFELLDLWKTVEKKLPAAATIDNAHLTSARHLALLGLFDEAAPAFEASQAGSSPPAGDLAYTIAVMNRRGDRAYKAVAFAEPIWRSVPADFQVELIPRDQAELLYPAPYRGIFREHSVPRNVDPRFLLSIVRQESRYRPDVKSYAAARGMMQFISTTSNKIAAELGRGEFEQDELYDPSTAILFGSQYTQNLFKLFTNQPDAVAASYNGGEENMRRWMTRSRSDAAALYVPEIAFSQTKDYVYRVMANYRVYQLLYDEELSRKDGY